MDLDIEQVLREAIERLATPAAGALALGYVVVGLVASLAVLELFVEALERVLVVVRADPELAEFQGLLEQGLAELQYTVGMEPTTAGLVLAGAMLASVLLLTVALDAFGRELDAIGELGPPRLGWKLLNLLVGLIPYTLLVGFGFVAFIVPGLIVMALLLYYPAAIAIDGDGVFTAFQRSFEVTTEYPLATVGVIGAGFAASFAASSIGSVVGLAVPLGVRVFVEVTLSMAASLFYLAVIARAFVLATADERGDGATADATVGAD